MDGRSGGDCVPGWGSAVWRRPCGQHRALGGPGCQGRGRQRFDQGCGDAVAGGEHPQHRLRQRLGGVRFDEQGPGRVVGAARVKYELRLDGAGVRTQSATRSVAGGRPDWVAAIRRRRRGCVRASRSSFSSSFSSSPYSQVAAAGSRSHAYQVRTHRAKTRRAGTPARSTLATAVPRNSAPTRTPLGRVNASAAPSSALSSRPAMPAARTFGGAWIRARRSGLCRRGPGTGSPRPSRRPRRLPRCLDSRSAAVLQAFWSSPSAVRSSAPTTSQNAYIFRTWLRSQRSTAATRRSRRVVAHTTWRVLSAVSRRRSSGTRSSESRGSSKWRTVSGSSYRPAGGLGSYRRSADRPAADGRSFCRAARRLATWGCQGVSSATVSASGQYRRAIRARNGVRRKGSSA